MKKSSYRVLFLMIAFAVIVLIPVIGYNVIYSNNQTDSSLKEDTIAYENIDTIETAIIFGTKIHLDERMAIQELAHAGILKCDTVTERDGQFTGAVVDFAGVKFGLNKGFLFLTSRHDKQAIDSLTYVISQFYGEPDIDYDDADYDDAEPEYNYYHWNLYNTDPDKPYIRIRPLHSYEGGLVMTWDIQ